MKTLGRFDPIFDSMIDHKKTFKTSWGPSSAPCDFYDFYMGGVGLRNLLRRIISQKKMKLAEMLLLMEMQLEHLLLLLLFLVLILIKLAGL